MSAAESRDSAIGLCFSNYRITAKLGAGGMGVVYKAVDLRLGRTVALKFLPSHASSDREKERFLQEARAASALDHPNISTIYGIEEAGDDRFFIVMAYYEGETLLARIELGALPEGHAVEIATQIAQGLAAAHAKGIVHRDIKPSNVMIPRDGIAKIVDFGLAKLAGATPLTQTGSTVGTAAYMSPEQAKGEAVDHRSDIWSLGVVLYEMLTGKLPFQGGSIPSVMYAIVHDPPIPLCDAAPAIEKIIGKALAKDPAERYQTADEMLDDLRPLHAATSARTRTIVQQGVVEAPPRFSAGTRRALVVGAVGVALTAFLLSPARNTLLEWARSGPAEKRVAVLPFTNVGADPANQALCDGVMETLTSRLSDLDTAKAPLWVVPAREVLRRKITDTESARRQLGATLVVTGSLQKDTAKVRLIVDLIDTRNMRQLGSAIEDNASGDLAAVQDGAIAKLAKLMNVESRSHAGPPVTAAPAAYESYLKGVGLLQRYDKAGNLEGAIQFFDRARQSDPQFALAYAGLGQAYLMKSQLTRDISILPQAESFSKRAVELDGQLAPAYVALGRIHDSSGQHDLAVQEFQRALKLDPRSAEAIQGLARVYQSMGRLAEAEDLLKKAAAMRPDYWNGYNQLGSFYYAQHRFQDAAPQFRRVLELTPDNTAAYNNLALTYEALDNWCEAQKLLETAIRLSPGYVLYSNLGVVYIHQYRFSEAAATFENALKVNEKDYVVWRNLADAYEYSGADAKAQAAYRHASELAAKAAKARPQDAVLQSTLGYIYARMHQRDNALLRVQSALALDPNGVKVLTSSAAAYLALGMRKESIECVNKAVEHGYSLQDLKGSLDLRALSGDPTLTSAKTVRIHK